MSRRVREFSPTLKFLNRYTESQKLNWLRKSLNTGLVQCICESAKNLLLGKVPLKKAQRSTLIRRKKTLRELVKRKVPLIRKKKIIQTGGFLGALLGPVISILSGLVGNRS
jgi:hypothetical protein